MERAALRSGSAVRYRSLAGQLCDATVTGVRADGSVDIDVDAGSKEPVHLTRIPVSDKIPLDRGSCA
jgi:hypothetical protein